VARASFFLFRVEQPTLTFLLSPSKQSVTMLVVSTGNVQLRSLIINYRKQKTLNGIQRHFTFGYHFRTRGIVLVSSTQMLLNAPWSHYGPGYNLEHPVCVLIKPQNITRLNVRYCHHRRALHTHCMCKTRDFSGGLCVWALQTMRRDGERKQVTAKYVGTVERNWTQTKGVHWNKQTLLCRGNTVLTILEGDKYYNCS
jgi:hypothetical protein